MIFLSHNITFSPAVGDKTGNFPDLSRTILLGSFLEYVYLYYHLNNGLVCHQGRRKVSHILEREVWPSLGLRALGTAVDDRLCQWHVALAQEECGTRRDFHRCLKTGSNAEYNSWCSRFLPTTFEIQGTKKTKREEVSVKLKDRSLIC